MKVLLISSIPPCDHYTAGIVLREMLLQLPQGTVVTANIVHPHLIDAVIDPELNTPALRLVRPLENGITPRRFLGRISQLLSRLRELKRKRALRELISQTVAFARDHKVDRVWAHLETPYPIRMALPVAEALGVPLYSMVFDPEKWYMKVHNMDPWTQKEVSQCFEQCIRKSVSCAVASDPMAEEYSKKYGVPTHVLRHCLKVSPVHLPLPSLPDKDTFIIGMAGQIYAHDAWDSLMTTLDAVDWHIHGRRVVIRFLGRYVNLSSSSPRHIEYLGWHSQVESLRLLADCDILYCPYSFKPAEEEVSRLSFPSKVSLYLAAARPVLFHGPEYASPARFFRETDSGLICTSLLSSELYNEIERIFQDQDLYPRLCKNTAHALNNNFSLEIMRDQLNAFLFGSEDK